MLQKSFTRNWPLALTVRLQPPPAPTQAARPPFVELLKLPLTAALVTGLLALATTKIAQQHEATEQRKAQLYAETERARDRASAQISAIVELSTKYADADGRDHRYEGPYVASLAAYGPYALPLLMDVLSKSGSISERYVLRLALRQVAGHDEDSRTKSVASLRLFLSDEFGAAQYPLAAVVTAVETLRAIDEAAAAEALSGTNPARLVASCRSASRGSDWSLLVAATRGLIDEQKLMCS